MAGVVLMAMVRSAACRSATGARNVTTTGWATPTTWPALGSTEAMTAPYGWFTAAELIPAGTATNIAVTPMVASTLRTTLWRMAFLRNYNDVN